MPSIVPSPQIVQSRDGQFTGGSQLTISTRLGPVALAAAAGFCRSLPGRTRGAITCRVTDDHDRASIRLLAADRLAEEAYQLDVQPAWIDVSASGAAGWFYGLQSLSLMLRFAANEPGDGGLACQRIEDFPRFQWRGMHLDVCRHFFDVAFIKRFLDAMALHKLNRFHWHLTEDQGWRIEIPGHPRLTEISAWRNEQGSRYGGIYSQADIRDVVQYASERHIQVVPEIELPGHSLAALAAYPEFACRPREFAVETTWGVFDDVYCAGNDATLAFLEEVLDATIGLFPGPVIHIGGDECPKTRWKECAKCQARMVAEKLRDEDQLQSWFVRRIVAFLQQRRRIAIGWDEILEGGLAPGAMVMSWRGEAGGLAAARMGHDVVMSPTTHCYFDYRQRAADSEPGFHGVNTLHDVYRFNPIPPQLTAAEGRHILGGQGNVWTERMLVPADVEFMVLPRMSALSEVLWTYDARDWSDFQRRLAPHWQLLSELGYRARPLDDPFDDTVNERENEI